MATKVTVSGKQITIVMDLTGPTPSKSGKSEIVASTGGFAATEARLSDGRAIKLNLTAVVEPK